MIRLSEGARQEDPATTYLQLTVVIHRYSRRSAAVCQTYPTWHPPSSAASVVKESKKWVTVYDPTLHKLSLAAVITPPANSVTSINIHP